MGAIVEGIDDRWLERAASADPLLHAYTVWDRVHEPDRTRFISYREGPETRAYLLVWLGNPPAPIVHWIGSSSVPQLLDALPPRPFMAVVPEELTEAVRARRGPIEVYRVELRSLSDHAPIPGTDDGARRLTPRDAPALSRLVATATHGLLEGYRGIDLARTPAFGAFEGERLVAVSKASVVLPKVWVLTGIVTLPEARGRGHGRAVTGAAVQAAVAAGARPGLFVRSDNVPAVRVYDRLGFERVARRSWIDAGSERQP